MNKIFYVVAILCAVASLVFGVSDMLINFNIIRGIANIVLCIGLFLMIYYCSVIEDDYYDDNDKGY